MSVTSVHGLILMLQRMPPNMPVLLRCTDGPEAILSSSGMAVSVDVADAWTDGLEQGEQFCLLAAESIR